MGQYLAFKTLPIAEVGALTSTYRTGTGNAYVADEAAFQIMSSVFCSNFFDSHVVKVVGERNKVSMLCACEGMGKSDGMQTCPILYDSEKIENRESGY
jgi:fructose-1,6-bisphosphatase/sedoheptulose 1,7-bisphosphatase-like protein